jgi:hypothetical protein
LFIGLYIDFLFIYRLTSLREPYRKYLYKIWA